MSTHRLLAFVLLLLFAIAPPLYAEVDAKPIEQTFDSNGVSINYIVKGEGEPVILVHGFPMNLRVQWVGTGVFDSLAEHFQVIAFDSRGHGKSGKPHGADDYGLEMVKDVIRLMDHLEIERAHVCGYSMGGFLTMKLVTAYPERVISAISGGAGWPEAGRDTEKMAMDLAESLENGEGLGPILRYLNPIGRPEPTPQQIEMIDKVYLANNDVLALAESVRGMGACAVTEQELRDNNVPTLTLIGEIDPMKASVDLLEGVMANHKTIIIDGADHLTTVGHPDYVKAMLAHLSANSVEN